MEELLKIRLNRNTTIVATRSRMAAVTKRSNPDKCGYNKYIAIIEII
jgi:hypothetical protein